jgi:RNA polymerase sigma factor (sigma-70 family)
MSDSDPSPSTRPSLLVSVRDPRDAASWQTFVDTYGPLVYRYGRRRGLQDADAADVMQEVLTEAARCLRTFEYRPERGRFRGWLGALTRRRLGRFFRQQARAEATGGLGVELAPEGPAAGPADAAWDAEFNARVLKVALDRIRPHFEAATWQAFEGVWLDGRPAAEVAGDLGVPIEAVYLAKSRALKRLREEVLVLAEDIPQLVPLG